MPKMYLGVAVAGYHVAALTFLLPSLKWLSRSQEMVYFRTMHDFRKEEHHLSLPCRRKKILSSEKNVKLSFPLATYWDHHCRKEENGLRRDGHCNFHGLGSTFILGITSVSCVHMPHFVLGQWYYPYK